MVNLSLIVNDKTGDPNQFDEVLKLVKEGVSKNITFVASAGNAQMDAGRNCPALDENIIIVGSISDSDGQCGGLGKNVELWSNRQKPPGLVYFNGAPVADPDDSFAKSYSNFGESVDIVAPGTNILSTGKNGTYHVDTGTSMASPAVAGAAAAYIAFHPDATPSEVRSELLNKAWRSGDGNCYYTVDDPLKELKYRY